ncbi:MAG TPA: serine hydrolase [Erythrobacter sp.]|uniref:serine hydrolase domain-containing protein n=1 Tax=unclassified Erythrobacter TaxID=2633097 RepID=UPI0007B93A29|nr:MULTISPECIES: serine hydrolase domain-containing protein [unclassified Erythrobacter]KZY94449.1 serine hydrolase [Erythrobacter sp. HI0074]KZZ08204.1 serine hydrolase [Erythrobacter sp. HI0077]HCJ80497.1 serine hydrolase [Erythrobacter sp.]
MAYREFDTPNLSRRALLRGGAWLTAGAALAGAPLGRVAMAQAQAGTASWPAVTALADKYVSERKVANMVATLGWGRQDPLTIARGTLALGGAAQADADSLYRIYSMTKPITGMAAMMLIDEGRLGLDQPIAELLPAYADMQVQKTYDGSVTDVVPAERPITVRQLLTHTAGLGYGIVQKGPITEAYAEQGLIPGQVSRMPIPGLGRAKAVEGLDVFADRLAELPLVLQPGTKWSYSVSLDLLGRVIEVASGMAFDEFLRTRIFEPTGMTSTWFTVPDSEIGRFTTNYGIMNGTPLPVDPAKASIYLDPPPFPFGGAGLVSSPRDYDRFLQMLLGYGVIEGRRVMGELAVRVGTSNLLPETATTKGTWVEGQGFGAGGRVSDGSYGWGGAAGTIAFVNYKAGLRANLMTQFMPSDSYPIHEGFPEAVTADLAAMQGAKA